MGWIRDKKYLIVAGRWNDDGGKPSGYARKLFSGCKEWDIRNGGAWEELQSIDVTQYHCIIWLADVPNDKFKLVNEIKKAHPKCLLVTSKSNLDHKYEPMEVIARALQTKSNLLLEFTRTPDGLIATTIWDALGNAYIHNETTPAVVIQSLFERLEYLEAAERVPSIRIGDALEVPDETEFFEIARKYASIFHRLIHGINPARFMGNLSFRCTHGFPSFRAGEIIFVSRRNLDKRQIGANGFVGVSLPGGLTQSGNFVHYFGDHKPSVDTAIQLRLYRWFPHVRYMLHSHAYLLNVPFTKDVVPCGDLREANQISYIIKQPEKVRRFSVNLRGHGSIVAADDISAFANLPYTPRIAPEIQNVRPLKRPFKKSLDKWANL